MPTHVTVNSLGLTYKSAMGLSIATIPDVCKTPSPGGPVPIPYPNIANQGSLDKGTKKVKAKGKMVAVKGSQYTRSNGDEAGTAGGVKSSVNMKATDWILYSFDVKMEGKNACRHTDKKFHNNQNTVDLGGNFEVGKPQPGLNPYQLSKWDECVEQHEKYDKIKKENQKCCDDFETAQGQTWKQVKGKIGTGKATGAEKAAYKAFVVKRVEIFERLNVERQEYIDKDCDDIPWDGGKPTKQERLDAHKGEVKNNTKNIKNLNAELTGKKLRGV